MRPTARAYVAAASAAALSFGMTATDARADDPKDIFEEVAPATVQVVAGEGFGTGVIYDAENGLILTNAHVVAGQASLQVRIGDKGPVPVRLMGSDPCEDLAVLKLATPQEDLKEVEFGDSGDLEQGDEVTAIGYPEGAGDITREKAVLTTGVVQSPDVALTDVPSEPELPSTVQHSATLNQGNSGGPLLDSEGKLVGVNTFSISGTQGQYNSISSDHAEPILPGLADGKSKNDPGWGDLWALSDDSFELYFPEDVQADALALKEYLQAQEIDGLYVSSVVGNSPAGEAKLQADDVITHLKGTPVGTDQQVCNILQSAALGEQITVDGVFTVEGTDSEGTSISPGDPWQVEMTLDR
ncbi:serine protease, S1-C subfamily, contains C-terminal PDZ domain [Streptomyces sp. cf386]|uniref:S1C family serine protease n=1 Tax=Streptomyces sp. cf386 TaxID=1761904 RepID=UPI0008818BE5|nr:S1C family serine protease [Streptomyces sp. cf386]SDO90793.1 serine protease, S1-C subfamily, contains C-terminal PDZ domain [Streptomyces sp. cf386]